MHAAVLCSFCSRSDSLWECCIQSPAPVTRKSVVWSLTRTLSLSVTLLHIHLQPYPVPRDKKMLVTSKLSLFLKTEESTSAAKPENLSSFKMEGTAGVQGCSVSIKKILLQANYNDYINMLPALAGCCSGPSPKSNFMVQIGWPNEEGFLLCFSTLTPVLIDVWFSDQWREAAERQIIQHEKCRAQQTKARGSSARGDVIKSCLCAAHTWEWVKMSFYIWRMEKVNFSVRFMSHWIPNRKGKELWVGFSYFLLFLLLKSGLKNLWLNSFVLSALCVVAELNFRKILHFVVQAPTFCVDVPQDSLSQKSMFAFRKIQNVTLHLPLF